MSVMKKLIFWVALAFVASASAQTVPYSPIVQGQIWTPAQWNAAWASKTDYPAPLSSLAAISAYTIPCNSSGSSAVPTACITLPSGFQLYPRTAAEIAAGVTPVNYGYPPGDFIRYGGDPTGTSDSTTAIDDAFLVSQTVYCGGGAGATYLDSHSIKLLNDTDFEGLGCTIEFTANVPGITNATGASVLYARVNNVNLFANVAISAAAMDLVDVSRSTFRNIRIDRGVSGMSWGYAIRLRKSASVCLWNRFYNIEADTITTAAVTIESSNVNENVFYGFKLINDSSIKLPVGLSIVGGGDNDFYGLDLEAQFNTNGAGNAYGVSEGGTDNRIWGLRTEGYTGSASFYGVNWNGSTQNSVYGHYSLGGTSAWTGTAVGNTYLAENATSYIGATGTMVGDTSGGNSAAGTISYDPTGDRLYGGTSGGGARKLVQSPALDNQDLNGWSLQNVFAITVGSGLTETTSGVTCSMSAGTSCTATVPTGSAHCAAYAQGATAYYAACSVSGTTATVTANASNSATWLVTATQ